MKVLLKWSEVAQSCPTLCDPVDCSLPGFSVHGIFQAKILEWVAISFSRGSSQAGFDPGLNPPCRQMLYCLSYQGSQFARYQGSAKVLLDFFTTKKIVTIYGMDVKLIRLTMVSTCLCMDVRVGLWRKLSAEELMLLNCGVGEDSWESLGLQGDPTSPFWKRSVLGVLWKEWC